MQQLQSGTLLQGGKYRIEIVLGQGGFGITYLAEQVPLKRKVAIKEFFMKDSCLRDDKYGIVYVPSTGSRLQVDRYKEKFVKEAQTLAGLDHPNIVDIIDVFEENGTWYYSMPFISGGSLKDLVQNKGKISEKKSLKYISQVANALKYMHEEKHICHFDVKPANILLDSKDNAILIDFGISKNYDVNGCETSTTPVGLSEGFAPIEQYEQLVSEFSPSSDVYALGATLYYLVMGKVPPTPIARSTNNESSFSIDEQISEYTKNLIFNSMIISKERRLQDVDGFIVSENEIEDALNGNEVINDNTYFDVSEKVRDIDQQKQNASTPKFSGTKKIVFNWKVLLSLLTITGIVSFLLLRNNSSSNIEFVKNKLLAKLGNAEAQYHLGYNYYEGNNVDKDTVKAVYWWTKSAEQGNYMAQYALGICYTNGSGVNQDYDQAFTWLLRAANNGGLGAQNNLAVCYANGTGVQKDEQKAVYWYTKAAEKGHKNAQFNLGLSYEYGTGVQKDEKKAVYWYTKAAEQGHKKAQFNLGLCYEYGRGVNKDINKALDLYTKAAKQGVEGAQQKLEYLLKKI